MIISTLRVGPRGPLFLFWRGAADRTRQTGCCDMHAERADGASRDAVHSRDGRRGQIAALVEPVLPAWVSPGARAHHRAARPRPCRSWPSAPDGSMTVEDCEISLARISPLLDVHDPSAGSLPARGVLARHRPAAGAAVGFRATGPGYEAKIELKEPVDGRKRFRGVLRGLRGRRGADRGRPGEAGRSVLGFPFGARRRGEAGADRRADSRGAAPRKEE